MKNRWLVLRLKSIQRFLFYLKKVVFVSISNLFYQAIVKKIKTWTRHLATKENCKVKGHFRLFSVCFSKLCKDYY